MAQVITGSGPFRSSHRVPAAAPAPARQPPTGRTRSAPVLADSAGSYEEAYSLAVDNFQKQGIQPTDEQLAAEVGRLMSAGRQSRTEGAPSGELSVDAELTPQAYMDNIGTRMRQLQDGGASNPLPGSPGFDTEGSLLAYRPGMDDREYAAAEANRLHRERLIRSNPGAGDFRDQIHSQQVADLGTADDIEKWNDYVQNNPDAKRRYDPAGFAQDVAAQRKREAAAHAQDLREQWGDPAAEAYLASQQSGVPMDMRTVRTTAEQKRIDDRRRTERAAREEGPEGPAREELYAQDSRSGYSGAIGGAGVSGRWSAIPGPDGSLEHKGQRFARKTAERKARQQEARDLIAARAKLSGYASPGQVAALQMLAPDARQEVIQTNLTRRPQGDEGGDSSKIDALRLQLEQQARQSEADRQLQRDLDETRRQEAEAGRVQTADEARRRFELQMAELRNTATTTQAQLANMQEQAQLARDELAQRRTEAENANPAALAEAAYDRERRAAEQARQSAAREQQLAAAESVYGPGIRDILDDVNPSYNTPAAISSLDKIARASDQSWTGFYPSDAERMDAILQRLGMSDADARRSLIRKHGMTTHADAGPGRGSIPSDIYNYLYPY